jgi:hypothetical protein
VIITMALTNIVRPDEIWVEQYFQEFAYADGTPGFYSFPCDGNGVVQVTDDNRSNYEYCVKQSGNHIVDLGVINLSYWDRVAAHGTCDCGRTVWLDYDNGYGVGCDCGRNYNLSGRELAPMSQWDEYMNDDDSHMVSEMNGGYDG